MRVARLILDGSQPGDWNMAADEAQLHLAADGETTLRFYEWSEPTLSLGYFQAYADRERHAASRNCRCVRRSSGGGAILHDHELTYSFAAPIQGRWAASASTVYAVFHETLVTALKAWGITARLCVPPAKVAERSSEPFLCFQRRSIGDVLVGSAKICGSAQRRHRGALLQHGSVVLQKSTFAPEIAGIVDLCGTPIEATALANALSTGLVSRLDVQWQILARTPEEAVAIEELRSRRFSKVDWLVRR